MLVLYLVYCLGCVGRRVLVAVLTSSSPPGCVGNTLPPQCAGVGGYPGSVGGDAGLHDVGFQVPSFLLH